MRKLFLSRNYSALLAEGLWGEGSFAKTIGTEYMYSLACLTVLTKFRCYRHP